MLIIDNPRDSTGDDERHGCEATVESRIAENDCLATDPRVGSVESNDSVEILSQDEFPRE